MEDAVADGEPQGVSCVAVPGSSSDKGETATEGLWSGPTWCFKFVLDNVCNVKRLIVCAAKSMVYTAPRDFDGQLRLLGDKGVVRHRDSPRG